MDTNIELDKETLLKPFDPDEFNEYLKQSYDVLKTIIKCYKYEKFVGSLILQNFYVLNTLLARGQYRLMFDYLSITKALEARSEDMEIERLKAERDEIEEKHQIFERMDAIRYIDELSSCLEDYRKKCIKNEKEGNKKITDKISQSKINHNTKTISHAKASKTRGRSRGTKTSNRGRGTKTSNRSRGRAKGTKTSGRGKNKKIKPINEKVSNSFDPMAELEDLDFEI